MKIRKLAHVLKLAEELPEDQAPMSPPALETAAKGVLGNRLGTAIGVGMNSIVRAIAHNSPTYDAPLGQLFAEYAADDMGLPPQSIMLNPRERAESLARALAPDVPSSYVDNLPSSIPGGHASVDDQALSVHDYYNELAEDARLGRKGRLEHFMKNGIPDISEETIRDRIKPENFRAYISYPRDDIGGLAHELGHVDMYERLRVTPEDSIKNKLRYAASTANEFLGRGFGNALNTVKATEGVTTEIKRILADTKLSPQHQALIYDLTMGMPLPVLGTGLLALASPLRDAIKYVSPSETINSGIDWIGENPAYAISAATVPYVANEFYTMFPGARLTHNFFRDLNNSAGFLGPNNVMANAVRAEVGRRSPIGQAAKFLGRNSFSVGAGAALPLGMIAANYLYDKARDKISPWISGSEAPTNVEK